MNDVMIDELGYTIAYNKLFKFLNKSNKIIAYKNKYKDKEEVIFQIFYSGIIKEDESFKKYICELCEDEYHQPKFGLTIQDAITFNDYLLKSDLSLNYNNSFDIQVWIKNEPTYIIYELKFNAKNEHENGLIKLIANRYNINLNEMVTISDNDKADDYIIDKNITNKFAMLNFALNKMKSDNYYTYPDEEIPLVEAMLKMLKKFNFTKYNKVAKLQTEWIDDYQEVAFGLCGDITHNDYKNKIKDKKLINNIDKFHHLLRHLYD